jgi:hypothetical protein
MYFDDPMMFQVLAKHAFADAFDDQQVRISVQAFEEA